jgi:hypothetical protein
VEIQNLYIAQTARRIEQAPPFRHKTTIKRIGLERGGLNRSYCAMFTPVGKVTYTGHGAGVEGNATGIVDRYKFKNICIYLDDLNLELFADEYQQNSYTISYSEYAFPDAYFLFETTEFTKIIAFYYSAELPLFRLIGSILDDLLDSAKWKEKDFLFSVTSR